MNPLIAGIVSLLVLVFTGGIGWYLRRYTSITEMLGMMIGMTFGMMTGITIGYLIGTITDMFVSNLIGVMIGVAFGVVFGRVGGLMGMMDGGMGGMMGGMMGAMLGVMLQYDTTAILVTTGLMLVLDVVAMLALVQLVRKSAAMQLVVDPVCKMQVDPERAISYVYRDRTYYFCARECQVAFANDPAKYVVG